MSYGYSLQAEYASGYVLTEDAADASPYDVGRNVFHAVLHGRATDHGHGPLVRLTLFGPSDKWEIDWAAVTAMPGVSNVRPVLFRNMERDQVQTPDGVVVSETEPRMVRLVFGYQYLDADGRNQQNTIEIT